MLLRKCPKESQDIDELTDVHGFPVYRRIRAKSPVRVADFCR
jgi:hypothetical protein